MSDYISENTSDEEEPIIGDSPPNDRTLLSNKAYDKLKPVVQIWLPALAVFYIAIAPLWGLPKQEEVAGTIMAFDLLLGSMLGIANRQYKASDARFDGSIEVESNVDEGYSNLKVQLDPQAIQGKDEILVKVTEK